MGMDGWTNISLAALLQMSDENRLFGIAESFDPELEDDFESWSNARPEVQAQIRRIRARNSQRDEWVRHDPKSARARRYAILKEAAREVYRARGSALFAVASCRHTHIPMFMCMTCACACVSTCTCTCTSHAHVHVHAHAYACANLMRTICGRGASGASRRDARFG